MAFLETFISKNIQKEVQNEKEVFPLSFQQLVHADTSTTIWWESQTATANLTQDAREDEH